MTPDSLLRVAQVLLRPDDASAEAALPLLIGLPPVVGGMTITTSSE